MDGFVEWPFEGDPKRLIVHSIVFTIKSVGVTGNRTRYQSGMYNYVHAKWTEVNLSGTAIIKILLPSQA